MTTTEQNLRTARAWLLDAFNNHRVEAVPDYISEHYINVGTTALTGHEAGRAVIAQADMWAPDRHIDIRYLTATDDVVMVLFTLSGTHSGTFQDIPATGRRFSVWMSDVFRFDDAGKMIEGWVIGKGDLRAALADQSH
ncbi:ester cyclase [Nocardia sp. NBC_00511]|uniref:ester cyclase n=1 Tax=Nocardia sp. NBC_00511 TaxID=2903591 RepID=UPI002F91A12E